jgi:hypothetical protein
MIMYCNFSRPGARCGKVATFVSDWRGSFWDHLELPSKVINFEPCSHPPLAALSPRTRRSHSLATHRDTYTCRKALQSSLWSGFRVYAKNAARPCTALPLLLSHVRHQLHFDAKRPPEQARWPGAARCASLHYFTMSANLSRDPTRAASSRPNDELLEAS